MSVRALIIMAALCAGPAAAGPAQAALAPWAALAGHCYRATFPDGKATDEHCWTWLYAGQHLRDVHEVRRVDGSGAPYRGEAIYSWDAKRGAVMYRYFNSQGGVSEGHIEVQDGAILAPEERYRGADGREQVFRSALRVLDATRYEVRTETLRDGAWTEAWRMLFTRTRAAG